MDYSSIIDKKKARLAEIEALMGQLDFYDDNRKAGELLREHRGLETLTKSWDEYQRVLQQIADNTDLMKSGDAELAAMAEEELPGLQARILELEAAVQRFILPPDPLEGRDVIMEIRAGTGGDEAALFAGDLFRMYSRYAEERGWKTEPLEASPAGVGGYKEVVFKVSGDDVFSSLKYESGVHRVQRVPATEAQGRIHTSAATVAVLPEAEDVDVQLKPDEVRIEVCRASGNGGQGVNTTDSAVQVLHIPTGVIVRCQDGRSQLKNKEKALTILRSRLLEKKQQEEAAKYSAHRRALIGSGGREEKIRTYNYPQNRITDHRIEFTLYNLDQFVEGRLDEMVGKLQTAEVNDRLAEAGLE
ncbi:peptide chain release factor 1 [Roseimicrobium gellanilyticum]|uniref:Peptide chain release factor 1 n=1 Tax=Roseimicrobium gellanilyticum TaxID=748857 RepID=A0A366HNN8_9BACT|nr:peptide chain release factor 1 [Roseimicrobium gellanilyticum]RBP43932.1 peptide chain release factor 1 [Roseimicrobium gellanilyticum]